MGADEETVVRFNEAINAQDLSALERLMADDHRFVDSVGSAVEGRAACLDAWRGFFESFPDYENVFDSVGGEGTVIVTGRSRCPLPELDGPALWSATVVDGRLVEWRVYDDTPGNRRRLGLG